MQNKTLKLPWIIQFVTYKIYIITYKMPKRGNNFIRISEVHISIVKITAIRCTFNVPYNLQVAKITGGAARRGNVTKPVALRFIKIPFLMQRT